MYACAQARGEGGMYVALTVSTAKRSCCINTVCVSAERVSDAAGWLMRQIIMNSHLKIPAFSFSATKSRCRNTFLLPSSPLLPPLFSSLFLSFPLLSSSILSSSLQFSSLLFSSCTPEDICIKKHLSVKNIIFVLIYELWKLGVPF